MRGKPERQLAMLSSLSTEDLIPKGYPIRKIRRIVDEVIGELDGEFDAMYSRIGRPSIPPEQLLKACAATVLGSSADPRTGVAEPKYDSSSRALTRARPRRRN